MIEYVGAMGAFLLAVSGAPQAWQCWRQGHARGLSWGLIGCWLGGEAAMVLFTLGKYGVADLALLANFTANFCLVAVIARYRIAPRS